ncbi:MAG: dihydroxyacetone kinase subunit K [Rhodobacter sp. CACIA14H1]|nr:MAG: dihydroxyacetone kinase subunit K [Rhodobacter sp. CACIA14H1]
MKKFINDPRDVVTDYLTGLEAAHPGVVRFDRDSRILLRAQPARGKVALVAGGGSGCEPLHTGFVGRGMLDAVCPGAIFTSPVPRQIIAATRAADAGAGVVHIVKNFTGEVMNFGIAQEIMAFDGIRAETVLVNDDVTVPDDDDSAGRRGLGATVLVEKIAGAAAERGDDLARVVAIARQVVARARTFSVGLTSCTTPERGRPTYVMAADEMDLGIGISGSPGRDRVPLAPARDVARMLADPVLDDLRPAPGAQLLVMLSGLGGTPESELYLLYGDVASHLRDRGFDPVRALVGNLVTSLDQQGAALTILALDDELTALWDAPVHTQALRWGM